MNMHTLKMFSFSLVALSLLASLTPAESQAAKLADGQRCSTNSACQSGSCTPGPSYFPNSSGPKYCLNRNLNCALPGTAGARYGQNYSFKGNTLKCLNPGLYGWGRLSAQFMLPVDKNHAPIKAPLKKLNSVSAQSMRVRITSSKPMSPKALAGTVAVAGIPVRS